jgi:dienelactone hydrolase
MTTPNTLYEEEVAASNPLRSEQARELEAYLARLREDTSYLDSIFKPDYTSASAYLDSTHNLRGSLTAALGYPPPGSPDGNPPLFKRIGEDRVSEYYRVRIPVLPGINAIGLYIVPKEREHPAPLVISQHGGDGSPELATFHGGGNYHDMVRGGAERGYVVLALQHLFKAEGFPQNVRVRFDIQARQVGTTLTAIEIAKITRSLDAVLERPEVDPNRIAMIGLSYGGFYTLYTAALEPRIKAAVSSCYFNDRSKLSDDLEPLDFSDWRFTDGLRLFRDPELAALICPRPLEIQVGIHDELFPIDGARREAARATEYYQKLGYEKNFRFSEFSGTHEWYGPSAWEFLDRHL